MMSRAQEMIERIHSDVVRCCELNNPIKVVVLNPLDFWTVLKEIGEHETPSPRVHVGTTYYPATHEEV